MKIGYVVKRYPRFSETFVVNEILAHEAAGIEVDVFALRPSTDGSFQEEISRVRGTVTFLDSGNGKASAMWQQLEETRRVVPDLFERLEVAVGEEARDVCQAAHLALEVKQRGVTHLHAHFATSATSVVRLAAHFADVPYSFTAHAKDIFHEAVDPADLRRKLRDARAVITVSDFNVDHLENLGAGTSMRLERIYNGLPLDQFEFDDPGERAPRILAVGRLVEKKGFADLIDACAELAERGVEADCDIIGAGPLEGALRTQIAERGLEGRVRLLGPLPRTEVIRALRESALMAAPCVHAADGDRDGLPTELLEAMALGTPCVATPVTGIPELVKHERTGILVKEHSPYELADAMERLLESPTLRSRLALRGRALIEEEFDVSRNASLQRDLFAGGPAVRAVAAGGRR